MSILYFISIIFLFITIITIKKANRKLNIITTIIVTIIAYMCYQAILAYFLDLLRIPINLLNVSIMNVLLSAILWGIYYFKIKQFQKYYIKEQDILFLIILLIVNIPLLYKEFGTLNNFRYISTDSIAHCQVATTFAKRDFLLDSLKNWEAVNPTFMIASYVNDGLLMKALVNYLGEFDLYKVYQFMDINYYIMIGIVFYLFLTSSKNCNTNLKYILAYIISILFMLAYPLNSIITGFHYFTLGILEFITILYVIKNLYQENNKGLIYIILFLLNTGIMLTYNLFAPILYLAEFIYFIYEHKAKKEKLLTKYTITEIIIVLIIPGIIGVSFFVIPRIFGNINLGNQQQIWADGYIYINYWSNIILFVPFVLYYLVKKIKQKKLNIEIIVLFVLIAFMALLFLGLKTGKVSTYYFMKPYYILNMLMFLFVFKSLCTIIDNYRNIGKIFVSICVILYIFTWIFQLLFVRVNAYEFKVGKENIKKTFDIYNSNIAIMNLLQDIMPQDRIQVLKYIHENKLINGQNLLFLGNSVDNFLFKLFFTYENREGISVNNIEEHIEKWNNGEYQYLVIFLKEYYEEYYKNILNLENSKIIMTTDNGVIYEKN